MTNITTSARVLNKSLLISLLLCSVLLGVIGLVGCGDSESTGSAAMPSPGPARGQAVFARYCNSCHPGGDRGAGPSLRAISLAPNRISSTVRNGKGRMPGFDQSHMSDDELTDLVSYVQSLQR